MSVCQSCGGVIGMGRKRRPDFLAAVERMKGVR